MKALVTGAGRGIGAAVARRLAADGMDVVVHHHASAEGAKATARAVEEAGRRAAIVQADLGDPRAAWRLAEQAVGAFGGLDVVVHNAGIYDRRGLADMTGEAWHKTLDVDLSGPAALTQALIPALRTSAAGAIVFVSSIAAMRGSTHGPHYAAAKAGLLGLTRSLALELPPIRVNAVAPGYIDTDMLDDDRAKRRKREKEVPLGRVGAPDEVAGVVSFLCGKDASYVTGTVLHVNGGLWMG